MTFVLPATTLGMGHTSTTTEDIPFVKACPASYRHIGRRKRVLEPEASDGTLGLDRMQLCCLYEYMQTTLANLWADASPRICVTYPHELLEYSWYCTFVAVPLINI